DQGPERKAISFGGHAARRPHRREIRLGRAMARGRATSRASGPRQALAQRKADRFQYRPSHPPRATGARHRRDSRRVAGRIATGEEVAMAKKDTPLSRIELLHGALDLIVLQAPRWLPRHGYGIAQMIRAGSREVL